MTRIISNHSANSNNNTFVVSILHASLLLLSLSLSATITDAWSPGSLFRFGRGPRLRPVPTNLCVLAGRPRTSSSVQMPEDFDNGSASSPGSSSTNGRARVTRQQQEELRSLLEHHHLQERERERERTLEQSQPTTSGMASSSFRNDIYRKKVDMASAAPQYFSPDPLESNINSNERDNDTTSINNNNNNGNGNGYKHFLQVPQLNLPTRIAQPGLGFELHNRALKSLVHERFGRNPQRTENNNDNDSNSNNDSNRDPKSHLVSRKPEWKRLEEHVAEIDKSHLRDLLQEEERAHSMFAEHDGIYLDYSRQRATSETMGLLHDLAKTQRLEERIKDMVTGKKINFTEKRAVLHTALRAGREEEIFQNGVNVVDEVHQVLDQIKHFTEGVRNGEILGYTGKRLRNIISVGIGGSYLGPEFLHEVLKTEPEGINSALGYNLRFLANVDPIDVERTCADLDPEETLIVVVSKTFTTAETMLNARAMRQWLWDFMGNDKNVVRKHIVACASISSIDKVQEFGIDTEKYFFRFWDWVGGRYSVCSAVGAVPISLIYGFDLFEQFLKVCLL